MPCAIIITYSKTIINFINTTQHNTIINTQRIFNFQCTLNIKAVDVHMKYVRGAKFPDVTLCEHPYLDTLVYFLNLTKQNRTLYEVTLFFVSIVSQ